MTRQLERKFINFKALKIDEADNGSVSGYRSVFGEIDEGGDIVVKGFFKDGIDEYLQSGFTAQSHDWDFDKAVGYPVEAKEDDYGFFVKSAFHSTPDAQQVRTKALERFAAGKTVGFSFGYSVQQKIVVEPADYKTELPKYLKADTLAANMTKAEGFPKIRILLKGETIEDSIVTASMNKLAMATGIKAKEKEGEKVFVALDGQEFKTADEASDHVKTLRDDVETKGIFEDVIAESEQSLWWLTDTLRYATYRAQSMAEVSENAGMPFDLALAMDVILSEFSARYRASVLGEDLEEDAIDDAMSGDQVEVASLNGRAISFKGDLRERLPFAKHAKTVRGIVEVFAKRSAAVAELVSELADRRTRIDELRESKEAKNGETKVGATYNSTNLSDMTAIHDGMGKIKKDVSKLHKRMGDVVSRGKKKEEKSVDANQDSDSDDNSETSPTIDFAALRTQSQKAQSLALAALN